MHYEIYNAYSAQNHSVIVCREKYKPGFSPGLLLKFARVLAVLGFIIIAFSYLPAVWSQVALGETEKTSELPAKKDDYQPAIDEQLPYESRLKIFSIGVDTSLQEATLNDYESALKLGVWRVSDFGVPPDRTKPTILAAHRYGYLAWSNLYRRENSFFNLSKLKVGDTVEIDWRQRKYIYGVYAEGRGEEIGDYSADLILYTCETLNSPIRIFKYARLLEI